MRTYTVNVKLYRDRSILIFDNKGVACRWLMHDVGSRWIPDHKMPIICAAVIESYIQGAEKLQSFINEYFNPDVVKLEVL